MEIYNQDKPYAKIYYDVHKDKWDYAKDSPKKNLVDFEAIAEMAKPIIVEEQQLLYGNEPKYVKEVYDKKELWEYANVGIHYYYDNPKYINIKAIQEEKAKLQRRINNHSEYKSIIAKSLDNLNSAYRNKISNEKFISSNDIILLAKLLGESIEKLEYIQNLIDKEE